MSGSAGRAATVVTDGSVEIGAAGSADAVLVSGRGVGAAVSLGGAHPGGGTKALLGSPERTGATATVMDCGAGVGAAGSAAVVVTGTGAGVEIGVGTGEADATTVGAA